MTVGIIFGFLMRFYTERQTEAQLIWDANTLFDTLKNENFNDKSTGLTARQALRKKLAGGLVGMESNFAVVSRDLRVLYPGNEDARKFKEQVLPKISRTLEAKPRKPSFMRIRVDNTEHLLVILPP